MNASALLGRPTPRPNPPVHLILTAAQLDGLIALANHAAPHIGAVIPDDDQRAAAERGLFHLRGAAQGLRPNDTDYSLERLAEALGAIRSPAAAELLLTRAADLLDVAGLWVAVERVHREATREDLPHTDRAAALLHPELINTLHWRLDAQALLRSVGAPRPGVEGPPPPVEAPVAQ